MPGLYISVSAARTSKDQSYQDAFHTVEGDEPVYSFRIEYDGATILMGFAPEGAIGNVIDAGCSMARTLAPRIAVAEAEFAAKQAAESDAVTEAE